MDIAQEAVEHGREDMGIIMVSNDLKTLYILTNPQLDSVGNALQTGMKIGQNGVR